MGEIPRFCRRLGDKSYDLLHASEWKLYEAVWYIYHIVTQSAISVAKRQIWRDRKRRFLNCIHAFFKLDKENFSIARLWHFDQSLAIWSFSLYKLEFGALKTGVWNLPNYFFIGVKKKIIMPVKIFCRFGDKYGISHRHPATGVSVGTSLCTSRLHATTDTSAKKAKRNTNNFLESVWILPLISFMLYFSVYLRLFLPSLHSLFLQIDHYLLRPNSANLLKNTSQLNLK